jgi:hypothetical protein
VAVANFADSADFCCIAAIPLFMVNILFQYVVKYFHLKAAVMFPQVSFGSISGVESACLGPFVFATVSGGSQDRQGRHMVVSGREGE